MALHPHIQEKAQKELDGAIGYSRPPIFSDFETLSSSSSSKGQNPREDQGEEGLDLPYIRAIMKEVLRWRPTGPMAIPHACIEVRFFTFPS